MRITVRYWWQSFLTLIIALSSLLFLPGVAHAASTGDIQNWQTSSNNLTNTAVNAATVKYQGYIYELGGNDNNSVEYAEVNPGGIISAWQASPYNLPAGTSRLSAVENNGYIYVMGGVTNAGALTGEVYYAQIGSNGSLGQWQTTTTLPDTIGGASSVVINGYIYEIGGYNGNVNLNTVYYAQIGSNGSLGQWQTTASLQDTIFSANAVKDNGYIYLIGGATGGSGTPIDTVYYNHVLSNGSLGQWQTTASLPGTTAYGAAVISDGYIYQIGGLSVSGSNINFLNNIYYSKINSDGTLSSWQTSANPLDTATAYETAITSGGYIYAIGGYNSSFQDIYTTQYAELNFADGMVLINAVNSTNVLFQTETGTNITCGNSVPEANLSKQDNGYSYPLGLFNLCFDTDDNSDTVKLTFITDLTPSQVVARDFNTSNNSYMTVPGANISETTYDNQPALLLTYSVGNTSPLNSSSTSGVINDPVGLAEPNATFSSTPPTTTVESPDTGYGRPSNPSALTIVLVVSSIMTLGCGFRLIKKPKSQL